MLDLYREHILEHAKYPQNYGELPDATIVHEEHNPLCGDELTLYLRIEDDVIKDVGWSGKGCAISQAATSMLTDELIGKSTAEAKQIDKQTVLDLLGIPIGPMRLKCALLSLKALKAGVYGINNIEDDDDLL